MSASADLVNKGFIVNRPSGGTSGDPGHTPGRGRTFIVTGLQRSGTTLVSAILRQVGIFMGAEINDIVQEDEEIERNLVASNTKALTRLIAERDAAYGTWGFKFPMLWRRLRPDGISMFQDPHIIVPFRDPVSIAVRTSLSEYQDPMTALRKAGENQTELLTFLGQLPCPTLLLSYEKSLIFPGDFIDAILGFCELPRSDALRDSLIRLIEPNRPAYLAQARRRYEGVIDGVSGGWLHGWCRLTGVSEAVPLDLFADDRPIAAFRADRFRQDVLDAGFGTGHHAFSVDLGAFHLSPETIIRVKVGTHGVELENGGRPLSAYS